MVVTWLPIYLVTSCLLFINFMNRVLESQQMTNKRCFIRKVSEARSQLKSLLLKRIAVFITSAVAGAGVQIPRDSLHEVNKAVMT